jgi:hypothetical protein
MFYYLLIYDFAIEYFNKSYYSIIKLKMYGEDMKYKINNLHFLRIMLVSYIN